MRILVLGAYGFIGLEIARRLHAGGHVVTGLARSAATGRRLLPAIRWRQADLATLVRPELWHEHLRDIDVVVNAAGALQRGSRDDVVAVQQTAIIASITAAQTTAIRRYVQISAPRATPDASTEFLRTKAAADLVLKSSAVEWAILRPGLIIGPNAYGGTALLRALAAFPFVQPLVFSDRLIQTVALAEVVDVVIDACTGVLPSGTDVDLVAPEAHMARDVVGKLRAWLGIRPARAHIEIPTLLARGLAALADALGFLGWRSPLRSTALQALSDNVVGEAARLRSTGRELSSLDETLLALPATLQDRWFARLYLAMPFIVAVLSGFWVMTGVIVLLDVDAARRVIPGGVPFAWASVAVMLGAWLDIALGAAILYRPMARAACIGMAALTAVYLLAGTWLRPDLWSDPLGPFLKALPVLMLALVAFVVLEER